MPEVLPPIMKVRWTLEILAARGPAYPWLEIDFADGSTALVDWELKLLRRGHDAVFLGPHLEQRTAWVLPADPSDGRFEEILLRGFTDDPRILRLAKEFLRAMRRKTFAVREFSPGIGV